MSLGPTGVQEAIYAALNGNVALMAVVTGVHGAKVPETATFPYVTIGDDSATSLGMKDGFAATYLVPVHVWSQSNSRKESKDIMKLVRSALHLQPVTISGATTQCAFDFEKNFLDSDQKTWHGVVQFRLFYAEN